MADVLFIIAPDNFRDEELFETKQVIESEGHKCMVASTHHKTCKGMLGRTIIPDLKTSNANMDDFDAVVIVGGSGAPVLAEDSSTLKLLKQARSQDKLIAAICLGPMIPAKAGVLKGIKATVYRTDESIAALEQGGAVLQDMHLVVDQNTVTADGPKQAKMFGQAIAERI